MMLFSMRFLNKIQDVNTFHFIDEVLYTISFDSNLTKFTKDSQSWSLKIETQHNLSKFKPNKLYSFSQFSKITLIDDQLGVVIANYQLNFKPIKVIDGQIFGTSFIKNELNQNKFQVYSWNENDGLSLEFSTDDFIGILITDKNIICQKGYHYFNCFNIESKDKQYQFDIRDLLEGESTRLSGDIIEYKKLILISISNREKKGIYAIDIETGEVVNQTNDVGGFLKLANDLLYINSDYVITTLNPNTFDYIKTDYTSILEPKGLHLGRRNLEKIVNNHFYFVSESGRSETATIGIIDLDTKELVWQTQIPIEKGSYWISKIEVIDNRLLVLTQGGTLHIFEREETN